MSEYLLYSVDGKFGNKNWNYSSGFWVLGDFMKRVLVIGGLLIGRLLGQVPEGPSVLPMSAAPPSGATNVLVSVVGAPQQTSYCYWVVTVYPIGEVASGPNCTSNSNGTLNSSNFDRVTWTASSGGFVLAYWVVRAPT